MATINGILQYNPDEPKYNPDEPKYNPDEHQYNPDEHQYNPDEHQYNPDEHQYNPDELLSTLALTWLLILDIGVILYRVNFVT